MGIATSFWHAENNLIELMHTIHRNDINSFKRKVKYATTADVMLLFLEAIQKERRQFFDYLLEKLNILTEDLIHHIETGYYEQCFAISINCVDPYFSSKLLEVSEFVPVSKLSAFLRMAVHVENEFIAYQLIQKGADVNAFDIIGQTPLDDAIKCNNSNLVHMLLYHGAQTNHVNDNFTSFMYAIICQCSEEIQSILIEYETDFNITCKGTSLLFFAIKHQSPVMLDIIERGADVSYYDGIHNSISLAMLYDCNASIFRVLWEKFDYCVWTISYSKSVFVKFLQNDTVITDWEDYLYIFMENETKLEMDVEHHNNSYFCKSDPIVSLFFLWCYEKGLSNSTTESFMYHLLSHGAQIFRKDLDIIYNKLGDITPFLESLLYMDLQSTGDEAYSVMYFKYTPIPDKTLFIVNSVYPSEVLVACLKYLRKYYALEVDLRIQLMDILGIEDVNYDTCRRMFEESVKFPSLLELSRDATRLSICSKYRITNSCKLYTVVKHLNLPRFIEKILFFDVSLYYFST